MKIKDLQANQSLKGVRFIYPKDGEEYYWVSQWAKGVWGRKEPSSLSIFPLHVDDLKETLEWEITENK
jgi:hypothetical protein